MVAMGDFFRLRLWASIPGVLAKKAVLVFITAAFSISCGAASYVYFQHKREAAQALLYAHVQSLSLPRSNAQYIHRQGVFRVTFSATVSPERYTAELTPKVALRKISSSPASVLEWQPAEPLAQGSTYTLTIRDREHPDRPPHTEKLVTAPEPKVAEATTTDHLYVDMPIILKFSEAMDQTGEPLITQMAGSGRWVSPTEYHYSAAQLTPATTYSYKLKDGIRSANGGELSGGQEFSVSTPGVAVVVAASPKGTGVGGKPSISFTFDQPMDHASVEARFSVNPKVAGSFSWKDNTVSYAVAGYEQGLTYSASIGAGAASLQGLPSNKVFNTSFTTPQPVVRLPVPNYKQDFALSCEMSALRMVLAFRGVQASDLAILQAVGYSPRNRDRSNNSWDDPNLMFVGSVNGRQNETGYGVYAGPIVKAAGAYGRPASASYGVGAGFIAQNIHSGNPVIVWGWNKKNLPDSWNSPSGPVQAWVGEHARVVTGVVGRPESPVGFYVNDPATGTSSYWSAGSLVANMSAAAGSNQAVVVR
jgi:uncharacterized protein YvpB